MSEPSFAGHKPAAEYDPTTPAGIVKEALRTVKDPEIGLDVVQLGLIREINLDAGEPEIKMMLTTPFCPYGGYLIQQIKDTASHVYGKPVGVNVLPDMWDPNFMEDPGLLAGW